MTTLHLKHIDETPNSTVSALMLNGVHLCYVIEDGYNEVKVPGWTRLYARTYEVFPRKDGGFFNKYKRRFGHEFVIGFVDAVEFDLVLIHIGNGIENTRSCLLCNTEYYLGDDGNYRGAGSTDAYKMLHEVFKELFNDGKVFINIDRGAKPDVVGERVEDNQEQPSDPVKPENTGEVKEEYHPKPKGMDCGSIVFMAIIAGILGTAIASIC